MGFCDLLCHDGVLSSSPYRDSRKCERVRGDRGACVLRRNGAALTAGDERAAGHRPHRRRRLPGSGGRRGGDRASYQHLLRVVGYLEAEGYIDPSPNATLVGAIVFRITDKGMAWLETPAPEV